MHSSKNLYWNKNSPKPKGVITSTKFQIIEFQSNFFFIPNFKPTHITYSIQHYSIFFFVFFSMLFQFFSFFFYLFYITFFFFFSFSFQPHSNQPINTQSFFSPTWIQPYIKVNTPYFLRQGKNSNQNNG